MTTSTRKIRFDKSGYYFIGLIGLVLLGFWKSYFSKFFDGTENYPVYFHFHGVMMSLWILVLIVQPILIRKKKLAIHKFIGNLSYILMPLLFLSVFLLTHYQLLRKDLSVNGITLYGPSLIVPFKELLILGIAYITGVVYRHNINIHARAMVATGIAFIEAPLVRFLYNVTKSDTSYPYILTQAIIYSILIGLIIIERKQKSGRWIFPLILSLYIVAYSLINFQINFDVWEKFAKWFVGLPLP